MFGTAELAAAVVEALEGRLGALMANHGADGEEDLPSRTCGILLRRGWLAS